MTTTASAITRLGWILSDALLMTKRNLLHNIRVPELLFFSLIQPIIFVLLFSYVFGGSIEIPGVNYIDYMMAGIIIQTVAFGSTQTGVGLSDDLNKGMIDRFRSLPMSRGAVLAGRTLSDAVRNLFIVLVMMSVGLLIGFRPTGGFVGILGGIGLALLFGFALSWISASIAMFIRDTEAAQVASFVWIFPLTFASSAFADPSRMKGWVQTFAEVNPVSKVINATRDLVLNGTVGADFAAGLAWSVGILAVFGSIAVWKYRRMG